MIGFLAQASDFSIAAAAGLIGACATAYGTMRMLGPNRRKIVEETSTSATQRATGALETALNRYESDNQRLRTDMDELEQKVDDLLIRLRAVEDERDDLKRRMSRMLRRFTELGEAPPA